MMRYVTETRGLSLFKKLSTLVTHPQQVNVLDINGSALSLEGNLLPEPNKIKREKGEYTMKMVEKNAGARWRKIRQVIKGIVS
jgi:hypothetical protein